MKHLSTALLASLALAFAVGGYVWWGIYQDLIDTRGKVAALDNIATLRSQLWTAKLQVKNLTDRLAKANGQGDSAVAGDPNGDPNGQKPDPNNAQPNMAAIYAKLMRDPEFRRLQSIQMAAFFDQNFAGLMKQLNLPPDQLAKFKALALERISVAQDAYSAAIDAGLDPQKDGKQIRDAVKQQTDDVDAQIKGVIGDAGWKSAMTYANQSQPRLEATQLQTTMSYTASPMTDQQVQQLSAAIVANPVKRDPDSVVAVTGYALQQPALLKGQMAGAQGPMGGVQPVPAISDEAINASAGFLSQQQVTALKQMQAVQQSQQQLGQIMKTQQAANGGK